MADNILRPGPELMEKVPDRLRQKIISGMRWTLWLSILAAPFGYGTNILLARVSPEALGTYGLLMVYIALVSCWFYLGGDAVVIKYVPTLNPSERLGFLLSYLLVVCAFLPLWLGLATIWPGALHYLLGESGGTRFHVLVICLSPIPIIYSLVAAALKGTMEIRWAQAMRRVLTIGSFIAYCALLLAAGQWLRAYYTYIIWGVYLGLASLTTVLGARYLVGLESWKTNVNRTHFGLPQGFWRFTFSLQQLSALTFFIRKLDYLLVLNFGGLAVLGLYVAIISLADLTRVLAEYFLETLLPSLTNLLAAKNSEGASQVFSMNLRVMFIVSLGITSGLLYLVSPITALLGPAYIPLHHLFVLMLVFFGISVPGSVGATLLTSVGKQQQTVWVGLLQVGLMVLLFLTLWPRYKLLGVTLAYGISLAVTGVLVLGVAKWTGPVKFSALRDYALFALVCILAGVAAIRLSPVWMFAALPAWLATMGLYLVLARYRLAECRDLLHCFVPGRFSRVFSS